MKRLLQKLTRFRLRNEWNPYPAHIRAMQRMDYEDKNLPWLRSSYGKGR